MDPDVVVVGVHFLVELAVQRQSGARQQRVFVFDVFDCRVGGIWGTGAVTEAARRAELVYAWIGEWLALIFGSVRAREDYPLAERLTIEHRDFPIYR